MIEAKNQSEILKNRFRKLTLGMLFRQDNKPAHRSAVALAAIQNCDFAFAEYPPYLLDLALSNLQLQVRVKNQNYDVFIFFETLLLLLSVLSFDRSICS